ncbi:GNAT family N-acetyltransferase [Mobilitalea sibirica]|uniref:GNAT family N-acetyltransferase n=1 Tax=Mobilitalea sibirica TaxID=1462919 RepID=A0A8J7HBV3_9FIRM|nr:GNAT family N-acetyltransferase [Mobilitalea sibirica]MBH1939664.1 GNAT family N-acetyltransferase [Mobilitalea sibirica]
MIKINTDRLVIRDHVEDDLDAMHSLLSDEKAMFYLPDIRTRNLEETKRNLQTAMEEANSDNRTKYFFAILDKDSQEYIGEIGFTKAIDCDYGNVMNLGYFIKENYWGKGIVTQACKAIINYAFHNLHTIKIETGCITDNIGSEKVMKKLGMIKEAEFKNMFYYIKNYTIALNIEC